MTYHFNSYLHNGEIIIQNMKVEHIPQIIEIENNSFSTPWSPESFRYEVENNEFADYIVLVNGAEVVGYAGIWLIIDEAHLTTIAVKESFKGNGLGEKMIIELIRRVLLKGGTRMTLEVRPSNLSAQSLYNRMGFVSYGRRKGYYTDNNEDAIIMWKELS